MRYDISIPRPNNNFWERESPHFRTWIEISIENWPVFAKTDGDRFIENRSVKFEIIKNLTKFEIKNSKKLESILRFLSKPN
jgi:hypothetical protein